MTAATKTEAPAFGLGAHVRFNRRAAVARRTKSHETWNGWSLLEGTYKNEMFSDHPAEDYEPPDDRINKTVIDWPYEGTGTVIGVVRRGIGVSVSPTTSTGSMYSPDDWEPGWFEPHTWVTLYAVKQRLDGVEYILVPLDAVSLA